MRRVAALTALSSGSLVLASSIPVEKTKEEKHQTGIDVAINILKDFQSNSVKEGKEKATAQEDNACDCKTKKSEYETEIKRHDTEIAVLKGKIGNNRTERDTQDGEITTQQGDIKTQTKERNDKKKDLKDETATYRNEHANDLQNIRNVRDAKKALLEGNAGAEKANALLFLQKFEGVGAASKDYDSKATAEVIKLCDGLIDDMTKVQVDRTTTWTTRKTTLLGEIDAAVRAIANAEELLANATAARNKAIANIKDFTAQFSTKAATKANFIMLLNTKTKACLKEKAIHDGFSSTNVAMTKLSTGLITELNKVKFQIGASTKNLLQESPAQFVQIEKVVRKVATLQKKVAEVKAAKSFLSARSPKEKALALIRASASSLKSTILASLATSIDNPFAKVTELIKGLISKLEKQNTAESDHHGWCTKNKSEQSTARDNAANLVTELNAEMQSLEAEIDELKESIRSKRGEVQKNENDRAHQVRKYNRLISYNDAAIKKATGGKTAMEKTVMPLLNKEVQVQKDAIAKMSGDKKGEAQDTLDDRLETLESLRGHFEVFISDFDRTITEYTAESKEQSDMYQHKDQQGDKGTKLGDGANAKGTWITEVDSTIQTLNEEIKTDTSTKNQKVTRYGNASTELDTENKALQDAIKQLISLKKACDDPKETTAERNEKREAEIEALKEAYTVLDEEA